MSDGDGGRDAAHPVGREIAELGRNIRAVLRRFQPEFLGESRIDVRDLAMDVGLLRPLSEARHAVPLSLAGRGRGGGRAASCIAGRVRGRPPFQGRGRAVPIALALAVDGGIEKLGQVGVERLQLGLRRLPGRKLRLLRRFRHRGNMGRVLAPAEAAQRSTPSSADRSEGTAFIQLRVNLGGERTDRDAASSSHPGLIAPAPGRRPPTATAREPIAGCASARRR